MALFIDMYWYEMVALFLHCMCILEIFYTKYQFSNLDMFSYVVFVQFCAFVNCFCCIIDIHGVDTSINHCAIVN